MGSLGRILLPSILSRISRTDGYDGVGWPVPLRPGVQYHKTDTGLT